MRVIALLCFYFIAFTLQAQYQAPKILTAKDSVIISVSLNYGKIYKHTLKPKETVYSLARTFGQKPTDISRINPGVTMDQVGIGQVINIPFEAAWMAKTKVEMVKGKEYVPIYYRVAPKENMFRIAKIYFDQSIENIIQINNLKTTDLKIGQILLVGWLPLNGEVPVTPQSELEVVTTTKTNPNLNIIDIPVKSDYPVTSDNTIITVTDNEDEKEEKEDLKFFGKLKKTLGIQQKNKDIKEVVKLSEQLEKTPEHETPAEKRERLKNAEVEAAAPVDETTNSQTLEEEKAENTDLLTGPVNAGTIEAENTVVYKFEKGIAIWNQNSSDSKNLFALHKSARVGSYIELTNPMMNKTILVKVIGNIPPRTYTDDVSIVISPKVANMLGAVDRRFMVKMKYYE